MTDLRSAALNADDITIELVAVPEWGGAKYGVKSLTLNEQRRFVTSVSKKVKAPDGTWTTEIDRDKYATQLIIAAVVDPDTGEPVFEQADADTLNSKSGRATTRLVNVAARLAGLGGDEQMDDTVTELKEMPGYGSGSD